MKEGTFLEHLEELRLRIIKVLVSLVIAGIIGYYLSSPVLKLLARSVGKLYFFAPTEAFFTRIKVGIYIGLLICAPVLLYHFWAFVGPALTDRERRYTLSVLFFGTVLFFIGGSFGLFILFPLGLKFLLAFGGDVLTPMINVSRYLTFLFWCVFGCGILFELPIVVYFLIKIDVVSPESLSRHRAEAIVGLLVVCAIITPTTDFFTLLLVEIPLIVLYESSLLLAKLTTRRKDND
ncbi:MAG: twin-arginine translocase subunit TatC [candidate division WOR-3 bacterium]